MIISYSNVDPEQQPTKTVNYKTQMGLLRIDTPGVCCQVSQVHKAIDLVIIQAIKTQILIFSSDQFIL